MKHTDSTTNSKRWAVGAVWRIIPYGYAASYIIIILPIFVFLPFKEVESAWKYALEAFNWTLGELLFSIFWAIDFVLLALGWRIYAKLTKLDFFQINHAWSLLGGATGILTMTAVVNWAWWDESWAGIFGSEAILQLGQGLGIATAVSPILPIPTMLLGTALGLLAGVFCKDYPTKLQMAFVIGLGILAGFFPIYQLLTA